MPFVNVKILQENLLWATLKALRVLGATHNCQEIDIAILLGDVRRFPYQTIGPRLNGWLGGNHYTSGL